MCILNRTTHFKISTYKVILYAVHCLEYWLKSSRWFNIDEPHSTMGSLLDHKMWKDSEQNGQCRREDQDP